jgi:hypothetical protein
MYIPSKGYTLFIELGIKSYKQHAGWWQGPLAGALAASKVIALSYFLYFVSSVVHKPN